MHVYMYKRSMGTCAVLLWRLQVGVILCQGSPGMGYAGEWAFVHTSAHNSAHAACQPLQKAVCQIVRRSADVSAVCSCLRLPKQRTRVCVSVRAGLTCPFMRCLTQGSALPCPPLLQG